MHDDEWRRKREDLLREVYTEARRLHFSAYPAHGSGFVTILTAGDLTKLRVAIEKVEEIETLR